MKNRHREGLSVMRLFMVLSSLSPVFILWAIQGVKLIEDSIFIPICAVMVIIPNTFLILRVRTAKINKDTRTIAIGRFEDHREHLLLYLFTTLLPFFSLNVNSIREFALVVMALSFMIFLFWHANFHYMNVFFAIAGYRIYTVYSNDSNPLSGKGCTVLITKRMIMHEGLRMKVYRISDTVYLEEDDEHEILV